MRLKTNLLSVILLLVTFFIFSFSFTCAFTNWDDNWMLLNNPLIRSLSFSNLKEIFFGEIYMMNYQPLIFLSYAVEYYFFGLNPHVFHFTNVLFHILNVLLVYRLIYLLSEHKTTAFVAALLFAVHPMHVESVAWITGRRDMLYSFFYLLSLIQYMKYVKPTHGGSKNFILSVLFFLFSCMSKGMAVSLPLIILLIDYFMGRKARWKLVIEKIPFFMLAAMFGVLSVYATHTQTQIELYHVYTLPERLLFACYGVVFYLYKLLLPVNLSAFHPYPAFRTGEFPVYFFLFPMIILIVTGLSVYSVRFSRKAVFGVGFFFATIFMVLQIMPVYNGLVAERYTYIAYTGLFFIAGEAYRKLYEEILPHRLRNYLPVIAALIVIVFSYLTFQRTAVWKNSETLWSDVIHRYPFSTAGYLNRGQYYSEINQNEKALADYTTAIKIRPTALACFNRGNIFARQKNYGKALSDYNRAIELKPDYCEVFINRGLIYYYLKQFENSISDYTKTIVCNPQNGAAYLNRSLSFMESGDNKAALQDALMAQKLGQKVNEEYLNKLMYKPTSHPHR